MSVNNKLKQTKGKLKAKASDNAAPDFIQKLFKMLEDESFKEVFFWTDSGTSFVVRNTNTFSRQLLPQHFKHSNFASFVRQLNKYDFHKVRNGEDNPKPYGDQAWEFVHPKFIRDRKDLLEDIKRKVPGQQQMKDEEPSVVPQPGITSDLTDITSNSLKEIGNNLQLQINQLKQSNSMMEEHINTLQKKDDQLLNELMNFSNNMIAKDNLIKEFLTIVTSKEKLNHLHSSAESEKLWTKFNAISKNHVEQMNKLNAQLGIATPIPQPQQPNHISVAAAAAAAASMNAGSLIGSPLRTADGLAFVTLGRLSSNMAVRDNQPNIELMPPEQTSIVGMKRKSPTPSSSSQVSWTVPPRILLVDDDSVYRDLSGKLLSVIGCRIDLAKDGVEALKKMGLEKYDLILMDIMMPKMDGISATRSIRQYDALTPIISMTSNFSDSDIMQYIGSGMTDILPKPFSRRTLYQMLEKHCAHLKAMQRTQGLDPVIPQPLDGVLEPVNNCTFPLAPYPYPVTMNSVPTNVTTPGDLNDVTFWPQQPQLNQPPAIIPNSDGKFTWAIPDITHLIDDLSNKKPRIEPF